MNYQFDGENKIIHLIDDNDRTLNAQDLYSKWKNWLVSDINNMKYPQAMRSFGGDAISQTKYVAPYIEVLNGWIIKPFDGNYTLVVEGNLFGENGSIPFVNADNGTVIITMETTGNALALKTGDNSCDLEATINTLSNKLDILLDIEQGNWEIKDNQMIFYRRDGTELMRFNLYDKEGNLSDKAVFKRERV